MASQLTKRGYKYRVLPTNDSDTFNDFLNDDSEFNIKKLDADLEKLDDKVLLEGKRQQKFDFIENSSIGIVDTVSKTGGQIKISDTFDYSDSFVFGFKYIANSYTINGANRFLFNLKNDNLIVSCIQLGDTSGIIGGFSLDIRRNDNTIVFQGRALFKVEKNVPHQVLFTLKDNVPSFFFDGALITFSGDGLYKVESNFPNGIFIGGNARPFDGKLIYNFYNYSIPAPQEIEHSFSVLNNYPSIKELHTTDSTGKTSILPTLYKESKKARGTLIEVPYDEPRDLKNYIYKFI